MESMKQITVNSPGVGDMVVFRADHALHGDRESSASTVGHDIAATCGEDGVVYLVDLATEQVVFEGVVWDGPIPTLAVVPEQTHLLLVSGDEQALYSYHMPPQFAMDKLLLRSPVAIRHVACSDRFIAVATEDTEIKVLRRAATDEVIAIAGHHEHGIKSVAFDAARGATWLCSSSEDGTVRVFELHEESLSATPVARFAVGYADIRSEDVLARCAWQPPSSSSSSSLSASSSSSSATGRHLAVPTREGTVELMECQTWAREGRPLQLPLGQSQRAEINVLSFSPNGLYVAAATLKNEVVVWQVADQQVVRVFRTDYRAVAMQWGATQNLLTVFNDGGRIGFVRDVVPAGRTPPHHLTGGVGGAASVSTVLLSSSAAAKSKSSLRQTSRFVEDEAMEGKHDRDQAGGGPVDDDDDEEAEFDEGETRVEAIKASFGFGAAATPTASADLGLASQDELDDDDDDDGAGMTRLTSSSSSLARGPQGPSPLATRQEPFQPGCARDGSVALLAWSPLGEIECIRGGSAMARSENLIKVEFADKSRRGFKFSDNYLFSMAALDAHGAFFAVPRRARESWDDDALPDTAAADHENGDIIPSFIFYRPFESWASNSSWHLSLARSEDAECIAVAREFCAVATSLLALRVYTTSGLPFALLRLPGRIVTMAARDEQLAVVCQDVCGRLQYQLLTIQVSNATQRVHTLAQGQLPLSPPVVDVFASHKENEQARQDVSQYATLAWLGFDERGLLYAVDSVGVVQALARSYDWQWAPLGCVGNALQQRVEDRTRIFTLGVVNNALLYFPLNGGDSGRNAMTAPRLRGKHRPVPLKYALQTASFPVTRSASSSSSSSGKKSKSEGDAPAVNELWQQIRLGALGDHDASAVEDRDLDRRVQEQAEMDKSLILMMKAACASDDAARVLDLAKCLHLEKSHQIAQKLAIHFGLRQLQTHLYDLYRDRFEQRRSELPHYPPASHVPRTRPVGTSSNYGQTLTRGAAKAAAEPHRPRPRLGRQPKPTAEEPEPTQQEQPEEEDRDGEAPSSPVTPQSGKRAQQEEREQDQSVTEKASTRAVAPANPFLKKPATASTASANATNKKKSGGLGRLADFSSPPPVKRLRTWK